MSITVSRRHALALGGVGAVTALTGCSQETNGGQGAPPSSAGSVALPDHVKRDLITPDRQGSTPSVPDAFVTYPAPVRTVAETPGDGSTVTVSTLTFSPPPTPVGSNSRWQAINSALGAQIEFNLVPQSEYNQKFATMMTSQDLPDIILIMGGPRVREFVATTCADLTEHLSGPAINDYPNLANLPESAWQSMGLVQGRIMGVPIPRLIQPYVNHVNRDVLDAVGATDDWSAEEFEQAMRDVTQGSVHGFGASSQLGVPFFASALGAANQWGVDNGQFSSTYDSDEFRAGLEMARKFFAEDLYHPEVGQVSLIDLWNLFLGGNIAACYGNFGSFSNGKRTEQVAGRFHTDVALPFGQDNTGWAQPGMFGWVAFNQADPERIKMLLRICDFLAAPFGSTEYELLKFGVEGEHFVRGDNGPETTAPGEAEPAASLPFDYITDSPEVIHIPGSPEGVDRAFAVAEEMIPKAITDPSEGLFSATFDRSGSSLMQRLGDTISSVVSGRTTLDAYDEAVAEFLEGGGKAIADEYSEAAANR